MSVESVIKPIDTASIHKITSGQVVVDLQTAVKELVENSIDAGATNIEVRFKHYGVKGVEVIDNGCGIAEKDHDSIALKHHTSKLASFSDLTVVRTFGFRGEALSSLCNLCDSVVVTTSTSPPLGMSLEFDRHGRVQKRSKIARQRGTTVSLTDIFSSLPVRRKELERNAKREFGKALALLNAYALGPCCSNKGVRLTVSNQMEKGPKTIQLRTAGSDSNRASVTALWGPKAIEHIVDLDLKFDVERDKLVLKRLNQSGEGETHAVPVIVKGLVSKFSLGCGRTGTDRQFFYVNGRPCNLSKVQKAFNEVYRTFNATQAPFILADFIIPTDSCDINISPDKRTIFIHSEGNLISALKASLEATFESLRSTYAVGGNSSQAPKASGTQSLLPGASTPASTASSKNTPTSQKSRGTNGGTETSSGTPTSSISNNILKINRIQSTGNDSRNSESDRASPPAPAEQGTSEGNRESGSTAMDVDEEDENPRPSSSASPPPKTGVGVRPNAKEVVITTSTASWNQPPPNVSDESESSDGPNRKRRKSGIDGATSTEGTASKAKRPDMRGVLRNKIASFARTGSHPQARGQEISDTESEDETPVSKTARSDSIINYFSRRNAEASRSKAIEATNHDNDADEEPDIPGTSGSGPAQGDASRSNNQDNLVTRPNEIISRPEVIRASGDGDGDVSLRFGLSAITEKCLVKSSRAPHVPTATDGPTASVPKVPLEAGVSNTENDTWAADALARVIDKEDFAGMDVVGQFNLGFIVARRRKLGALSPSQVAGEMDDLFIVDQHAADEKYNFETLQQTTKLESQKLFRPQPLELTAADELLAIENIDVLRQNGFEIETSETNGDENNESDATGGLKLIAQPVSKTTSFDMKDLEEIIHLMRDRPTGQMVRCSKARAMFAMRACRKSFMVGMPLNTKQMSSIVQHMGTMDQPWNCPHGRPTMRHLLDLSDGHLERPYREVNWAGFQ